MHDIALENDLDITLMVFLKFLTNLHKLFFRGAEKEGSFIMDTKFYIRKLLREAFNFNKFISFEELIASSLRISEASCNKELSIYISSVDDVR